jgi:hypothetical protein
VTHEKIAAIENRRQLVDAVQRKADAITRILGDVRITLDSVAEQKAMVDHVFAELARLGTHARGARHDESTTSRAGCSQPNRGERPPDSRTRGERGAEDGLTLPAPLEVEHDCPLLWSHG